MEDRKIREYVEYAYKKGLFNGNWLIKRRGEVISRGSIGMAAPEGSRALDEGSVFEMASVSKHFTDTAILILRDRGLLSLDDPAEKYFRDFPYKGITIRHLMQHTSGVPDYMDWVTKRGNEDKVIYHNDIIERFLAESGLPLVFEPGDGWSYSNTGYCMLALIIEKVSGRAFIDFMREEIFIPSGMNSTYIYHWRKNGKFIDNYAYGMVLEDGRYIFPDFSKEDNFVIPLDGAEGDGMVNTCIDDMMNWDMAQRNHTVLSKESTEEMWKPARLNSGEEYPYGYGWFLYKDEETGLDYLEHSGGWPGYNTRFVRIPGEETMLVAMANQTGCDITGRREFFEGLKDFLFGRTPMLPETLEEKRDTAVTLDMLEKYCGEYEKNMKVFIRDGQFRMYWKYREELIDEELVPTKEGSFYADGMKFELSERRITSVMDGKFTAFNRI